MLVDAAAVAMTVVIATIVYVAAIISDSFDTTYHTTHAWDASVAAAAAHDATATPARSKLILSHSNITFSTAAPVTTTSSSSRSSSSSTS